MHGDSLTTLPVDVLIVANESDTRHQLRKLIEEVAAVRDGFESRVTCVQSLSEGVDLARRCRFDVALLDGASVETDVVAAVTTLLDQAPSLAVVIASPEHSPESCLAIKAGAQDVVYTDGLDAEALCRSLQHAVDRQQIVFSISESEQKYRSVVEQSTDATIVCSPSGDVIEWDHGAERLFGLSRHDAVHRSALEILTSLSADNRLPRSMISFLRSSDLEPDPARLDLWPQRPVDLAITRSDGTRCSVQAVCYPISTRGSDLLAISARDITERVRIEEVEREQRLFVEALQETLSSLTNTLNYDEVLDRILAVLERVVPHDAARIMVIREGTAVVLRGHGYERYSPDAPVEKLVVSIRDASNLRTILQTGQPSIVSDTRKGNTWIDNPQTRWVRSSAGAPLRYQGLPIGMLCVDSHQPDFFTKTHASRLQAFADQASIAMENARLYQESRQHALELETRVAERTADLEEVNRSLAQLTEQLKEVDRLKSTFLSNVSHELRTPLTNIKAYVYLLDKNEDPVKRRQYIDTLQRESSLLESLIEDLLQLSRVDLGKVRVSLTSLDVGLLVATIAEDRRMLVTGRGLTLVVDVPDSPAQALADRKLAAQVFTNLLTNAMNYTPAGGTVFVKAWTVERGEEAPIPDGGEHRWVAFSVRDTGQGIPDEERDRVFERFYRGVAAVRSSVNGTGLGLAICRELMELQHGVLTLDSIEGKGSVFTAWFPVRDDEDPSNDYGVLYGVIDAVDGGTL